MHTKSFPARVKAVGADQGLEDGQVRALVSVFGNEDSYGDVVVPGAFAEDLDRWKSSGDPIPFIWSHDWGDPFSHVGHVLDAEETAEGLVVTAQIDDMDTNPKAGQVHRLLKGRRVTQFSFAYDVVEGAFVEKEDHRWGGYYELRKMRVHEVGPCLIGANQETELLAAKAADLTRGIKAGRVLSQTNYDRLTKARDSITAVLDAATPEDTNDAKQHASQPASGAASGSDPAREPDAPPAKQHGRSAQAAARLTLMTALNGA
ncbi:HK97 family phage prohead protease [Nocardiopsis sp. EMB25]|uniref:HK97 family phage prohead protease n=1 Tax=Nocardiopsis sp. EMB25 TaxID=2835867 RepID=UPI0022852BA0|nr:HK97 family phage prohead protease [Nocardiopsis sp. EMB25]MCY9786837.1 HK97 family phage prohead protease [Nocardiopsis sp. EMB25]